MRGNYSTDSCLACSMRAECVQNECGRLRPYPIIRSEFKRPSLDPDRAEVQTTTMRGREMGACCMGRLLHGRIGAAVAVAVAVAVALSQSRTGRASSRLPRFMMAASTPNPNLALAPITSLPPLPPLTPPSLACIFPYSYPGKDPLCCSWHVLASLGISWHPWRRRWLRGCDRCRSESNAFSIMSPFTFTFQASKPSSPLITRHSPPC